MLAILITLDCAREDHVTGPRALTPCLDAFREEAVTFSRAYAHTNTTLPSHVTMMTGALMPEHGVTDNHCVPSEKHLLLTERLAGAGVSCAGFVGIQFLEKLYASKIGGADPFYARPSNRMARGLLQRLGVRGARRGAGPTAEKALRWVRATGSRDAFCWLHLFDTHMDYLAGGRWRRHYDVPERPVEQPLDRTIEEQGLVSFHPVKGERRPLEYYPRMYQAAISHTDEVLGRFIKAIKAMNRYDDALIVVTADHGENLLEHGAYCSHPLLFEETIRVPLAVKFPGHEHSGEEVSWPVGHQDLLPTFLRYFGSDFAPPRCRDLGESIGSPPADGDRPLFAFHNKMMQACVRQGPWLYVENLHPDRVSPAYRGLYDETGLFARSGQRAEDPAVEAELGRVLHACLDQAVAEAPPARLDEDDIKQQLEGLGYL